MRLTKNDLSKDSLVQEQGGQKIDLIDVEIQPRSDTVKILSHRKTRKIISADLNSIIDESKSETRLKSPGKLKRQFLMKSHSSFALRGFGSIFSGRNYHSVIAQP